MENQQLEELIRKELPRILQRNPKLREWVLQLTREHYAGKQETDSRFNRILDELKADREEDSRKWAEQNRRWEEQNRRWEEQNRRWQEQAVRWEKQDRRWEEQAARWEEQNRRWEEQAARWEEQNRKWEANQQTINAILATLEAQARKHESSIGALGARWGLYSEQSFRNGLKGILEESFGVEVLTVTDYDESGEVFGHPDQVELDVIIQDGMLILCEIKSSMSKADMYTFQRKTTFYEKRHARKAARKLVISPMVDQRAEHIAHRLGIEVYTHADDVKPVND